jgi:hypothetical protein
MTSTNGCHNPPNYRPAAALMVALLPSVTTVDCLLTVPCRQPMAPERSLAGDAFNLHAPADYQGFAPVTVDGQTKQAASWWGKPYILYMWS